jgi:hypothetical protein
MQAEVYLDDIDTPREMHPALDIVNDTLYVGVRVLVKDQGPQDRILTSAGEVLTPDDLTANGLYPRANLDLSRMDPATRWSGNGINGLLNGTLNPPTFKATYDAIRSAFDARLVMEDPNYLTVMTLFTMMTYFTPVFDKLPVLWSRAVPGTGKSRAGVAIGNVAYNGQVTGSTSRFALFRDAHAGLYTQVLTEMDDLTAGQTGDALLKDLHSGTSKDVAWVTVSEQRNGGKGPWEPQRFYIYAPRVLCTTVPIKSDALRSRTIRLDLQRSLNADPDKLDLPMKAPAVWAPLRDKLYRLQLGKWQDVRRALDEVKQSWRGPGARQVAAADDDGLPVGRRRVR